MNRGGTLLKPCATQQAPAQRVLWADLLRCWAVFCMMVLHVAANNWSSQPVDGFAWNVLNGYDSAVRFCVPVFVMLSGMFFLDPTRPCPPRKLFGKNLLRLACAFLFWSACYAVAMTVWEDGGLGAGTVKSLLRRFVLGHYHLWFLFTLGGLYLIVPFLREITKQERLMRYFLLLWFVFACVVPLAQLVPQAASVLQPLAEKTALFFPLGYTGYFVGGYYLASHPFSRRGAAAVYALGIASVLGTALGTAWLSRAAGAAVGLLYANLLPNTCFAAVAVFVWFQRTFGARSFSTGAGKAIRTLSEYSFGMYLVHELINYPLTVMLGITAVSFWPVAAVPLLSCLVFALSFCVVFVLRRVPFVRRFVR